jgi:predicted metal-dependent phosphoesterase TrpH
VEFDLHGHTNASRLDNLFFGVAKYSPTQAVKQAKKVGLSGIAITDHNTLDGVNEALEAGKKHNLIIVPGVELITRCGARFPHLLALGITEETIKGDKIPSFGKTEDIINWIHRYGGVAIAVHPRQNIFDRMDQLHVTFVSFSLKQIEKLAPFLDGVEIASPHISAKTSKELINLAEKYNLAQLKSSDFHKLEKIGLYRTKILAACANWQMVIEAIRKRKIVCS